MILEYYWADKVQGTRESELKWRVKENIVDTLISFIWLSFIYTDHFHQLNLYEGHGYHLQLPLPHFFVIPLSLKNDSPYPRLLHPSHYSHNFKNRCLPFLTNSSQCYMVNLHVECLSLLVR